MSRVRLEETISIIWGHGSRILRSGCISRIQPLTRQLVALKSPRAQTKSTKTLPRNRPFCNLLLTIRQRQNNHRKSSNLQLNKKLIQTMELRDPKALTGKTLCHPRTTKICKQVDSKHLEPLVPAIKTLLNLTKELWISPRSSLYHNSVMATQEATRTWTTLNRRSP